MTPTLYRLPAGGRNTAAGVFFNTVLAVLGLVVCAIWAGTQYVAWQLAYHPYLGTPLLTIPPPDRGLLLVVAGLCLALAAFGLRSSVLRRFAPVFGILAGLCVLLWWGPLYAPLNYFVWRWQFGEVAGTETLWESAFWIVTLPAHGAFLAGLWVSLRQAKRIGGPSDLHGSARWASRDEIGRAGLLGNTDGVMVGAWDDGTTQLPLRHDGPQHVLGFAPSRSGKGVGLVIPTLLSWPHSVLVHDIKGENWALTAGWRKQAGQQCLKFDPTCGDGSSAHYNPLWEVRPWPQDVKDAQNIADMLVDPDGDGLRDHWDLTAHDLLVGVILHVLYTAAETSLHGCLTVLTDPSQPIEHTLRTMLATAHDPTYSLGWTDSTGQPTQTHPVVAGAAQALLNKSDNERSSVISSAVKFLNLYRDPIVAANTARCDFALRDLLDARPPISLYLTTPPSEISRTRPLMRLLLNQVGRRLTESMDVSAGPLPASRARLLLLLDEFPSLGRLDFLQTSLAYLAGYGISAYLLVQDLSQLYHAYGREESIVSNCHVRVAFTPNKIETAKLLSDMAGLMTVHKETRTYTGGRLSPVLMHVMASEQESQRPLLTPDEVLRLPDEDALIFVAGLPPIYGKKIRYYQDPVLQARAEIPPPVRSDQLEHDWSRWTERPEPAAPEAPRLRLLLSPENEVESAGADARSDADPAGPAKGSQLI